ncbi:MAG: branched-chain amino acid aminotransferase [Nannocystaceae bacterium]
MTIETDSTFAPDPARAKDILSRELGFGNHFTDRMFTARYDEGRGWHSAKIGRFEDFQLSPAAAVLHYGQAIFEGQKVYRQPDGEVAVFRPRMNARRFVRSADRLVMPAVPEAFYIEAADRLVDIERAWVPGGEMQSLYMRPFMIATEPLQGVRPAKQYLFSIILSPVGAYYASGFNPVRIFVSPDLVRAPKTGVGEAKAAGNYAASLLAGTHAEKAGCSQVLWLDAAKRKYVEEIGAMNIMFAIDGALVTPPLGGSILAGVTRDSVLVLAEQQGTKVEERAVAIEELIAAIESGRCTEAFGCGTAAVITSIGSFLHQGKEYALPSAPGPMAERMLQTITDIQWGRARDPHAWMHIVPRRA